jgi:hypothetical protein
MAAARVFTRVDESIQLTPGGPVCLRSEEKILKPPSTSVSLVSDLTTNQAEKAGIGRAKNANAI